MTRSRQDSSLAEPGTDPASHSLREGTCAMTMSNQVRPGMKVIGANGSEIGTVKELRGDSFLVDRRLHRDVWVPLSAVSSVAANDITLTVVADRIADMNWPEPPLPGQQQTPNS